MAGMNPFSGMSRAALFKKTTDLKRLGQWNSEIASQIGDAYKQTEQNWSPVQQAAAEANRPKIAQLAAPHSPSTAEAIRAEGLRRRDTTDESPEELRAAFAERLANSSTRKAGGVWDDELQNRMESADSLRVSEGLGPFKSFDQRLDEAMTPWGLRDAVKGSPLQHNQDLPGFMKASRAEYNRLRDIFEGEDYQSRGKGGKKSRKNELKAELVEKYGMSLKEAELEIGDVLKGMNPNAPWDWVDRNDVKMANLRQARLGVPSAAADEGISELGLELAGFTKVGRMNVDNPFATDLQGTLGSGPALGIDAQQRMSREGLNLALFSLDNPAFANQLTKETVLKAINEGKSLRQFMEELSSIDGAKFKEDKGLQSRFNRHQITEDSNFQRNRMAGDRLAGSDFFKDLIISSGRADYEDPMEPGYLRRFGPFDPERPSDIQLVDLNQMRDDIFDIPMGNIRGDTGLRLNPMKNAKGASVLKLIVPNRKIIERNKDLGLFTPDMADVLVA